MGMNRKSICPVCGEIFEVFLRNQVCCREEHQKEWTAILKRRRDARRVKADDLDWANAKLEALIPLADPAYIKNFDMRVRELEKLLEEANGRTDARQNAENAEPRRLELALDNAAGKPRSLENEKAAIAAKLQAAEALLLAERKKSGASIPNPAPPKPAVKGKGRFEHSCVICGDYFRSTRMDDKYCCAECQREGAEAGI